MEESRRLPGESRLGPCRLGGVKMEGWSRHLGRMVVALGRLRQEDQEYKASLGYRARSNSKKKKKEKKKKKGWMGNSGWMYPAGGSTLYPLSCHAGPGSAHLGLRSGGTFHGTEGSRNPSRVRG
jgi:hypothetical protein